MSTLSVERPSWWNDRFTAVCTKTLRWSYNASGSFDIKVLDKLKMHLVKMSTRGIGYDEETMKKFWETTEVDDLTMNEWKMLTDFDYLWLLQELVVNDELRAAFVKPFDLDYYASGQGGSPVMCGYCLAEKRPFVVALNKDINQPRCARCGSGYIYQFTRELSESEHKKYEVELAELFSDALLEYSTTEDWKKNATTLREETGLQSAKKLHILTEEEVQRYNADPDRMLEYMFPDPRRVLLR